MGLLMIRTALLSKFVIYGGFEEVHALFIDLWAPLDIGWEQ